MTHDDRRKHIIIINLTEQKVLNIKSNGQEKQIPF